MYFSYGFPKSFSLGVAEDNSEIIYSSFGGDVLVLVTNTFIQLWSGGQHRIKLGEIIRDPASVGKEGLIIKACWCPARRIIAAATDKNTVLFYGVQTSKDIIWQSPDGQILRQTSIYLQNSILLTEEIPEIRDYLNQTTDDTNHSIPSTRLIADICGDNKSLLIALNNALLLSFSWSATLHGIATPFSSLYAGSSATNSTGSTHTTRVRRQLSGMPLQYCKDTNHSSLPSTHQQQQQQDAPPDDHMHKNTSPDTENKQPVRLRSIHYAQTHHLLTAVFENGSVAILKVAIEGLGTPHKIRFDRWIYVPSCPDSGAVCAALQPSGHFLAVGLAHGCVALYSMYSSSGDGVTATTSTSTTTSTGTTTSTSATTTFTGLRRSFESDQTQQLLPKGPDPERILSLVEWGYSSSILGASSVLSWSPDGRVLAVGYSKRGLVVWTPSGCRVMSSLRQAMHAMGGGSEQNENTDVETSASVSREMKVSDGSSSSSSNNSAVEPVSRILEHGISSIAWSSHGYSLIIAEIPLQANPTNQQQQQQFLELSFARALQGQHRVSGTQPQRLLSHTNSSSTTTTIDQSTPQANTSNPADETFILQAADRLLLISQAIPSSSITTSSASTTTSVSQQTLHAHTSNNNIHRANTHATGHRNVSTSLLAAVDEESAAQRIQTDLNLQHIRIPLQYLEAAYPILHAAPSIEGRDIAVAGSRGLALYNWRARRWRFFGDALQERQIKVHALKWLPNGIVVVCATVYHEKTPGASSSFSLHSSTATSGSDGRITITTKNTMLPATTSSDTGGSRRRTTTTTTAATANNTNAAQKNHHHALLLYPKHHLSNESLLAHHLLPEVPLSIDTTGNFIALTFAPLNIVVLRVQQHHQATDAMVSLIPIRELSILCNDGPLIDMTMLHPSTHSRGELNEIESYDTNHSDEPTHCVMLRGGGVFSVLDMLSGNEVVLAHGVESYWLPTSAGATPHVRTPPDAVPLLVSSSSESLAPRSEPMSSVLSTPQHHRHDYTIGGGGGGGTSTERIHASAKKDQSPPLLSSHRSPTPSMGRDDSAATIPSTPAAKGAAWLERRASDAASMLEAAIELDEIAHIGLEMPWWTYGARGMQLWFPSSLQAEQLSTVFDGKIDRPETGVLAHNNNNNERRINDGNLSMENIAPILNILPPADATDPELEFDREVYPIGISLAEVSIIGIMQRSVRNYSSFLPNTPAALAFHPHPESQPVLPCLLRRLLEQGRPGDALELALLHSQGPHFARSLEWLLFTALEADADMQPISGRNHSLIDDDGNNKNNNNNNMTAHQRRVRFSSPVPSPTMQQNQQQQQNTLPHHQHQHHNGYAGPLLLASARLVQQFPQAAEIIVSVARKTDVQLWPALFAATGSPSGLCEGLLESNALQSAACSLLIVDHVEGSIQAHGLALRLLRASLSVQSYELVADLFRFLVPVGEHEIAGVVTHTSFTSFTLPEKQRNTGSPSNNTPRNISTTPTTTSARRDGGDELQQRVDDDDDSSSNSVSKGYASMLWSYLVGDDKVVASKTSSSSHGESRVDSMQKSNSTAALHKAVSATSLAHDPANALTTAGAYDPLLTPGIHAWRAMGHHAWKLLDSGALKQLSRMGMAMGTLHGGLPALLSTTAREMPLALGHITPSAAAIASALFVASNEFAFTESGGMASIGNAEALQRACHQAGCVNHAAALALLLGDSAQMDVFAIEHPRVWAVLSDLIANDVHLCGFMSLVSPPGTPLVVI